MSSKKSLGDRDIKDKGKASSGSNVPSLSLPETQPTKSAGTPSGRSKPLSRRGTQFKTPEQMLKQHKFRKTNFKHPTWCLWSNKFIWGLDKTGFECVDCEIAVSRKCLAEAKLTVCEGLPTLTTVRTADTGGKQLITGSKIFTVHLPEGQRRSVMFNPFQKLSEVIGKICRDRNWNVSDYVACDSNGTELDLRIMLSQIKSFEITFTLREAGQQSLLRPPLIADVKARLEAEGVIVSKSKHYSKGNQLLAPGSTTEELSDRSLSTEETSFSGSTASGRPEKVKMRVKERYDIADVELGIGAFSTVLQAADKVTKEIVAIKVIDRGEAGDDQIEQAKKFQQEFEIHSSLLHDHIVEFIMMDETPEHYYVVMELVSGGELFDQVIARSQFEEKDAALLLCQVLSGLCYMHKKGIAHRDLKPENLLFKDDTYTVLKIADFGESKHCTGQTLSTYCGTPDYMAPEIIQAKEYGVEVDMWAMGCIAYIMMAGFPPFDGENDAEILSSIVAVKFDFPMPEWEGYSKECKDFISGLLVADRSKRMTSQQALDHPFMKKHCTQAQRENINGREPPTLTESSESNATPRHLNPTPIKKKPEPIRSGHRKSMEMGMSSSAGDRSPRGEKGFDMLDLAALQANFNETSDEAKPQILAAIDILYRFATLKSVFIVADELTTMQSLISEIPGSAAARSEFQVLCLKTFWIRLAAIKVFISVRKEKKKGGVLSKGRKDPSSKRIN